MYINEKRRKSNISLGGSVITETGLDTKREWRKKLIEDALLTTGNFNENIFKRITGIFFLNTFYLIFYFKVY